MALSCTADVEAAVASIEFRLGVPLEQLTGPDDIANAVVFLLSDRARHITLLELRVDGGAAIDA